MSILLSPNMNLPVPSVGSEDGPDYAFDINNCMTLIDRHDHTPGNGVLITPAAISINATLPFNDFPVTLLEYVNFQPQPSVTTTLDSLSVAPASSIDELWYTDSNGNSTQITKNGTVNVVASSIPGESYVAGTFIWTQTQSALPTTPANFDIGSIILRPNTASTTNGVTLVPPSSVATSFTFPNYSVVLTGSLPLGIPSTLKVDPSGNVTPIASGTNGQFLGLSGSQPQWLTLSSNFNTPTQQVFKSGSGTYTTPAGCRSIKIRMIGAGGGGGGGGTGTQTNGAAGTGSVFSTYTASGGNGGTTGSGVSSSGAGGDPVANVGSPTISLLGGAGNPCDQTASVTALLNGGSGGNGAFGGAGKAGRNTVSGGGVGGAGQINTGGGGGGGGTSTPGVFFSGGGGAAGSYVEQTIPSPSATYSYTVGAGGAGGFASGTSVSGGAGGSGLIIVDEYY